MPQAESDTPDITSSGASYTMCRYHMPGRAVCQAVTVAALNAACGKCKGEADDGHDQN